MADCTTDIANKIQLVINVCLVNEAGNPEHWFGGMYELPNEEAVTIANNILKFVGLRLDAHAQWEIQCLAKAVLKITSDLFPIAVGTWQKTTSIDVG